MNVSEYSLLILTFILKTSYYFVYEYFWTNLSRSPFRFRE